MTKTASDKPMRRSTGATPYAALWFTLGGAGLGYLCVAFFAPHLLPDFSGGRLSDRMAETQVVRVAADVEDLKTSLSQLQQDVESVKAEVSAQAAHTEQLSTKLTALDDKVQAAPMRTSALAEPLPPPTPDVPDFSGAPQAHAEEAPAAAPPPTKVINAAPPAAPKVGDIVTGSVNKKAAGEEAISFGPAVVKAEPKPVGIQLATDSSVDALRITWSALAQLHSEQLGTLTAQYADLGTAANPNYGLIAGPIKSKTEAKKICKELAAQSISCKISDFKGTAL